MKAVLRLRIKNETVFIGKGVRELLDSIEIHKSIKKATEHTGISYPKAIRMIKTLEQELKFPVVVSEKGGSTYGGTYLTKQGKEVLESYREIEKILEETAQKLVDEAFSKWD